MNICLNCRKIRHSAVMQGCTCQYSMQALAAQQEPVAWIEHHKGGDNLEWDNPGGKCTPLYTTPPAAQRTWVGLTEQEALDCFDPNPVIHSKNVEAKLRSKNYE